MPTISKTNAVNSLLEASKGSSYSYADAMTALVYIFVIALIICLLCHECSKNARNKAKKNKAKKDEAFRAYIDTLKQNLDHVKVLGTRTGTKTITYGNIVMSTNGTVYSLLLVYKDKRKETAEVRQEDMSIFTQYIDG